MNRLTDSLINRSPKNWAKVREIAVLLEWAREMTWLSRTRSYETYYCGYLASSDLFDVE